MKNFPLRKGDETITAIRMYEADYGYTPNQSELAAFCRVTPWAIGKRLRQLEKRGLIQRKPFVLILEDVQ